MRSHYLTALLVVISCTMTAAAADPTDEQIREEARKFARKDPKCMVTERELPRRVIIKSNQAKMFESPNPAPGAKPIGEALKKWQRMYVYEQPRVRDGSGYYRLGKEPFAEEVTGWVAAKYCLEWNHDEALHLDTTAPSAAGEEEILYLWNTPEAAKSGDVKMASLKLSLGASPKDKDTHALIPVLLRDRTDERVYKVALPRPLKGQTMKGPKDAIGKPLNSAAVEQIRDNLSALNIILVIDATGSMGAFIEEAKVQASRILEGFSAPELGLQVSFMLVAYRDAGDEFDKKVFVPLTSDVESVKREVRGLTAGGGGDEPEMVIEGIDLALSASGVGTDMTKGAVNYLFLIGDAPPHQTDSETLSRLGNRAREKYTKIYALKCGNSDVTEKTFLTIAEASGGELSPIASAGEMTANISKTLRERAGARFFEKKMYDEALAGGDVEAVAGGDSELAAFFLNRLSETGVELPEGEVVELWSKVAPGSRLRLYVMTTRWKLAQRIQDMLSLSTNLALGKKVEVAAPEMSQELLKVLTGEGGAAGMMKGGVMRKDVTYRGSDLPMTSPAVKAGTASIVRNVNPNRKKVVQMKAYLSKVDIDSMNGYIFMPAELAP